VAEDEWRTSSSEAHRGLYAPRPVRGGFQHDLWAGFSAKISPLLPKTRKDFYTVLDFVFTEVLDLNDADENPLNNLTLLVF